MKTIVKFGSMEDFFKRGRKIARLADKGDPIPCERIISFENADDLAELIKTKESPLSHKDTEDD
jgi:predicted transcriptional regulator